MSAPVPDVVNRYLQSAAAADLDTLAGCFTADAEVADDGATYHGVEEIRSWREALAAGPSYTVEVLGAELLGGGSFLVTTHVAGDFPGSPVDLRYEFSLAGDLIARLVIAP